MADFNSILGDVYTITGRPDLVAESKLAIKAATLKLHSKDFFDKDLYEVALDLNSDEYLHQLEYKAVIPRYRSLSHVRKTDANSSLGVFFEVITPRDSLDRYMTNRDNVVYLAGLLLKLRSSAAFRYIILGCYVHPDIGELTYTSWIADEMPLLVVLEAARAVLNSTGDDGAARLLSAELFEQYAILNQNIVTKGF